MFQAPHQSRGLHPIRTAAGVFRTGGPTLEGLDADTVRYAAVVSVWGRWFISVVTLFQFAYRFRLWFPNNFEFPLLLVLLVALNGLVHYRLVTGRPVTWRWLLLLSAMDIALSHGQRRRRRAVSRRASCSFPTIPALAAVRRRLHRRLWLESRLDHVHRRPYMSASQS